MSLNSCSIITYLSYTCRQPQAYKISQVRDEKPSTHVSQTKLPAVNLLPSIATALSYIHTPLEHLRKKKLYCNISKLENTQFYVTHNTTPIYERIQLHYREKYAFYQGGWPVYFYSPSFIHHIVDIYKYITVNFIIL